MCGAIVLTAAPNMAHCPRVMSNADPAGLLETVRRGLQARKGQWREIEDLSESAAGERVPYDTISKIARGATPNPGVLTVERLAKTIQALDDLDRQRAETRQLPLSLAPGR
jgi:hypothetical protein